MANNHGDSVWSAMHPGGCRNAFHLPTYLPQEIENNSKSKFRHKIVRVSPSLPLRWGDADTLMALFGDKVEMVSSEMNVVNYRYESAQRFVDHLRQFYGPTNRAFEAADTPQTEQFHQELIDVCHRFHVSGDSGMVVPAKYLSVVLQKR